MRPLPRKHTLVAATVGGSLVLFGAVPASAQQTGAVSGTVTDQETMSPLGGAQVTIVGTDLGALTDGEGSFFVDDVPAGEQEVEVSFLGYRSVTEEVTVPADETVNVEISLSPAAIELEGVVVDPITGREERRREAGTVIGNINVEDIDPARVTSFADLLSARAPGVSLQQAAGTIGTSERIRIRGANSISLGNEPLIYIDGVRATRSMGGLGVGGQQPSRLNDLNPNDIANIEIVKGPAAAALYGTEGANGVLLITTRRGQAGVAQWNAFAEVGMMEDNTDYPANFFAFERVGEGEPFTETGQLDADVALPCFNYQAAAGACAQDDVLSYNTLMDDRTRPFSTGQRQRYGLNVAGGTETIRYYLSGEFSDEQGVIDFNTQDRGVFRANVDAEIRDDLSVTVTSGYVRSRLSMNNNDNSIFSPLINGLLGLPVAVDEEAIGDPPPLGDPRFGFGFNMGHLSALPANQEVDRITLGVSGNYAPLPWLSANLNLGLDLTDRHDFETLNPGALPISADYAIGFRNSQRSNDHQWTAGLSTTAAFMVTDRLESTTTFGAQFNRSRFEATQCIGHDIPPNTRSCAAAGQLFSVSESFSELVQLGGYVQQQFGLDDRLFVTASLRGDDDSAFGDEFGLAYYPGLSASWVVSEEGWFDVDPDLVSDFRIRAAWGTSGLRPDFRQAFTLLQPVAVMRDGTDRTAVTLDRTGNPDLQPERTTEFEAGFDAGLVRDRLSLEFTYFQKESRDALVERRLAPSLGLTPTVFENLGSVRNRGIEASASLMAFATPTWQFDLNVDASTLSNEILELGEGIEPIIFNRDNQRHEEGYPAGAFFGVPFSVDPDAEGPLGFDDLVWESDEAEFIGPSLPTWTLSMGGDLTVGNHVRVSTLFDARGGHYQLNYTDFFRCGEGVGQGDRGCPGLWDPEAPVGEQAAVLGMLEGVSSGFVEPADFVKWRELAVSLTMPTQWAAGMGGALEGATLTLAGRNLATWTDYGGLDPEINETGGAANFTQGEFNTQPPLRHFTARLNIPF